jgi:anti-sigma B factor antagonist
MPDALVPPDIDRALVHVSGELDIATAPQLEQRLRESRGRVAVLDLSALAFMDSSGVHAIVDAGIRARQAGGRLVVLRGRPNVDRLFTLTGTADDVEFGDLHPIERAS